MQIIIKNLKYILILVNKEKVPLKIKENAEDKERL
jgi:hypothetical protein